MAFPEVTIGDHELFHDGIYIINFEKPEVTLKFENFSFRMKIEVHDDAEKKKTSVSSFIDEDEDIYTVVVHAYKSSSDFGAVKKPIKFLLREDQLYSFSFRTEKVMQDGYVTSINIYRKKEVNGNG